MLQPDRHDDGTLVALERYRAVALQEARAAHAQCAEVLQTASAEHSRLEEVLEFAYVAYRASLGATDRPLCVDTMSVTYHYARAQAAALADSNSALERARSRVSRAQEQVAARLEELKVIERLRENRGRLHRKWQQSRAQSRLDELGIIKACGQEERWPSLE